MTGTKILACLMVTGGFIWALVIGELIFNLFYHKSEHVRKWVGSWAPEDENWEEDE